MIDEQLYTVETPEQIDLLYDVAGIGSRFLAALIDHVLLSFMLSFGCALVAVVAEQLLADLNPDVVAGLLGISAFLSLCSYYIFFETIWNGQTPGKRLIGIRVVRTGGRPIGFLGSVIRNFIRLADFLPVLYGVGVLSMFIDRRSRRLGDFAAGALTIKERKLVTLDTLSSAVPIIAPIVPAATEVKIPNLEAVTPEDYDVVHSYLRSRLDLGPEARKRIEERLVQGLQTRLGYPVHGDYTYFLQQIVAEYQLLHRPAEPVAT